MNWIEATIQTKREEIEDLCSDMCKTMILIPFAKGLILLNDPYPHHGAAKLYRLFTGILTHAHVIPRTAPRLPPLGQAE